MKVKESVGATIMGAIFGVFLVFSILVLTCAYYYSTTVFNINKLVKSIDFSVVSEELINDFESDPSFYEYEEMIELVFESEFFDDILVEYFEAIFYGDEKVDMDQLEKEYEEATDEFFEDHDISSRGQRELKEEFLDSIESDVVEEALSNNNAELQNFVNMFHEIVTTAIYVSGVLTLIMVGTLLLLYKNKAKVMIITGISTVCAQGINLFGAVAINAFFVTLFNTEVPIDEPVVEMLINQIRTGLFTNSLLIFGIALFVGVLLIVSGSILSKNFVSIEDDLE